MFDIIVEPDQLYKNEINKNHHSFRRADQFFQL